MPALFLNLLKLIFLAIVYLFLWRVARAIGAHVGPEQTPVRKKAGAELVVVRADRDVGRRYPLTRPLLIGRSPDADVVVDDPYASDLHVRLSVQNGKVQVSDLGSTNGTYVNGRRVTAPVTLGRGDAVQVGKMIFEVR